MKKLFAVLAAMTLAILLVGNVSAQITPAGTLITNQATATYNVGPTIFTETSNITSTAVAELLDVSIVWQDATPITVRPGDTNQVITFLLTNTGNGNDSYTLTGLSTLGGDDFDPTLNDLYFDANGNGIFDLGIDIQYLPGVNEPVISADSSIVVFLLNNIPTILLDGDLGNTQLTATSQTGSGAPGTVIPNQGEGGTDAVVGSSGSTTDAIGTYVVSNVVVTITKSVAIVDPFGGTEPIPGAVMTYSLVITTSGTGTASNLVINDAIPANTTYVPGTLTLNAGPLTDGLDADAGDFSGTTANEVTVTIGDLAAPSAIQTITFDVIIN